MSDTKDRVEELFIWSSLLYEGIKEFFRRENELKHLRTWKANLEKISIIKRQKEHGTPYWLMLHDIRNNVMFHFYPGEIEKNLDSVAVGEEVNFALARTKQKKDALYTLSDEILWRYVFDRKGIDGNTPVERIEGLATYLMVTTETLISIIDFILIELLKPLGAGIKKKVFE